MIGFYENLGNFYINDAFTIILLINYFKPNYIYPRSITSLNITFQDQKHIPTSFIYNNMIKIISGVAHTRFLEGTL